MQANERHFLVTETFSSPGRARFNWWEAWGPAYLGLKSQYLCAFSEAVDKDKSILPVRVPMCKTEHH